MLDLKKLREDAQALYAAAQAHEEKYAADGAGDPTPEEAQSQVDRLGQLEKLTQRIENQNRLAKYAFEGSPEAKGVKLELPRKSPDELAIEVEQQVKTMDRQAFGKALTEWACSGVMPAEYAAITTATASGAFYPKQVGPAVNAVTGSALQEGMAAVGAVPVVTDSTADMNIPVVAMATGSDVTEGGTAGTDNTPTPTPINLKPVPTQSGWVWLSSMELQSLDYDLESALLPSLEDAVEARLEKRAFDAIAADAGITQIVATATTSGITYDNLVTLNRKLPRRFDRQKVIYLSDDAYALAEKLVGDDGHPILNRDPQNQQLLRFNGTPVIRTSNLQAFGTSKIVGVLVSFVGAKVRDAGGNPKLNRQTNDKDYVDQVGLNLIKYAAFGYVPAAVATLKTPAS
jgi:HK97 family phage major capsid protein